MDQPVRIDTEPPLVSIDPPPGLILGTITLSGTARDSHAGIARVALSTTGGTDFQELSLDNAGGWTYSWNTDSSPAGPAAVIVRAVDLAGNPSQVSVETTLARIPPTLVLEPRWSLGQQGKLNLIPGDAPLTKLVVQICELNSTGQCDTSEYVPADFPQAVTWNGTFAGERASTGEYAVTVTLSDSLGRTTSASARIVIHPDDPLPLIPTLKAFLNPLRSTPRPTATRGATQTVRPTATSTLESTPFSIATATPLQVLPTRPGVVTPPQNDHGWSIQNLLIPIFLVLFLVLLSSDPRPRALCRVADALQNLIHSQKEHYD